MWYFGSNIVEGVAKNSVEAEMSWLEVGPRFSNTLKFINYKKFINGKNSFVVEVAFKDCSINFMA